MLKSDFHMHSKEDWHDWHHITYSARQLIDELARQKFEVASITHHNHVHFNSSLKSYAKRKGLLLIPGSEAKLEGADVLLINVTNDDLKRLKTLDDIDKVKDYALIAAPHPFYKISNCLNGKLLEHIRRFHAIEYCHWYAGFMMKKPFSHFNGNFKAEAVAKKYRKALVGTSDAHRLYEIGTSFTWVDSEKKADSWINAIKKRKVTLETKPFPLSTFARRSISALIKERLQRRINWRVPPHVNLPEEPFFQKI